MLVSKLSRVVPNAVVRTIILTDNHYWCTSTVKPSLRKKKKKALLTFKQAPMKSGYHPYTEKMWKLCGIVMIRIDSLASLESYLCRARRGWMPQMLRHIETTGSSPPFPKLLSFYAAWLLLGIHFVIFPEAIDQDVVACFVSLWKFLLSLFCVFF